MHQPGGLGSGHKPRQLPSTGCRSVSQNNPCFPPVTTLLCLLCSPSPSPDPESDLIPLLHPVPSSPGDEARVLLCACPILGLPGSHGSHIHPSRHGRIKLSSFSFSFCRKMCLTHGLLGTRPPKRRPGVRAPCVEHWGAAHLLPSPAQGPAASRHQGCLSVYLFVCLSVCKDRWHSRTPRRRMSAIRRAGAGEPCVQHPLWG